MRELFTRSKKIINLHGTKFLYGYLLVFLSALYLLTVHMDFWGDEYHFTQTIQRFATNPFASTLYNYEEMSTPLPFILYALWGKLFGIHLYSLRLFSVIIAFFTYLSFYSLFSRLYTKSKAFLYTVFITLNPYMIGLSVFVFTDMLTIFFASLLLHAILNKNLYLLVFSISGALLCRQYFIFLPLGIGIFYLIQYLQSRNTYALRSILSTAIGCLPLFALALYWHGLTPDNATKKDYSQESLLFHPAALSLYISLIIVYCFPILLLHLKKLYTDRLFWISAIPVSVFQIFFPIRQPLDWIEKQMPTVGFFHKLISLSGSPIFEKLIFYICFLLSLPVLFYFIKMTAISIYKKSTDIHLACRIITITFFCIMPLSYMLWEKYFIPVIVFLIIGLENEIRSLEINNHEMIRE